VTPVEAATLAAIVRTPAPGYYLPGSEAERAACEKLFNAGLVCIGLQIGKPHTFRFLKSDEKRGAHR
jgi:hypothetical protein